MQHTGNDRTGQRHFDRRQLAMPHAQEVHGKRRYQPACHGKQGQILKGKRRIVVRIGTGHQPVSDNKSDDRHQASAGGDAENAGFCQRIAAKQL